MAPRIPTTSSTPPPLRGFLAWLGRHERETLLLIFAVLASAWLFVEIADDVMEGDTAEVDRAILLALRNPQDQADPLGPPWLEEMGRDITALGGIPVLVILSLATIGYLILDRKVKAALLVAITLGGGNLLSLALKSFFSRPRPDLVPHGSVVYTSAFPSGHSMLSAITFLTLGALLARVQDRLRLRAYFIVLAMCVTLLVGVSRVYLGVHWPTDVLAGWTAGAGWALFCWFLARALQRRGKVEVEPDAQGESALDSEPDAGALLSPLSGMPRESVTPGAGPTVHHAESGRPPPVRTPT